MIKDVTIPDIGENVDSGDVVDILVSVGDTVEVDQPIIEFETSKAVVEIPSPVAGKITEITVSEGDTVDIGHTIAKIDTEGEADAEDEGDKEEANGDDEAETAEKKEEEKEAAEPEKKSAAKEEKKERPAKKKSKGDEEDESKTAEKKETKTAPEPEPSEESDEEEAERPSGAPAPASPSVRRLARELGADISKVPGSGPGGRISADDVKDYVKRVLQGRKKATTQASATRELPDFSKWGKIEKQALSNVRNIIADNMAYSWNTVPHVTQFDRADITDLEKFREKYGKKVEDAGGKLTATAIIMKVCARALEKFPRFNASIDLESGALIYKKYYNIGMAVDTDRGLLVPVVRDVNEKSIKDLAVEIVDMAKKARDKKISPDDFEGGTFTISNQGSIGGTDFTPIVYWPQAAILGVSRATTEPVYKDGEFVPRTILPLSLSYDHRIVDGADAARFLRWITEALEHPFLLDLD